MKKGKYTTRTFTKTLAEKSDGNFMYLYHVLPAIGGEDGKLKKFTLDELPQGLWAYYREHWKQMQQDDREVFRRLYEPVVCAFAAADDVVSVELIAKWTELEIADVETVVREWLEFLREEPRRDDRGRCYRVYHRSFKEFLEEQVNGLKGYHELIARSGLQVLERLKNKEWGKND